MKKVIKGIILLTSFAVVTPVFATSFTAVDGAISLGQGNIPVGANVVLNYSTGDIAAVGGYSGCDNNQTMAIISGSIKPAANMALEFGVRGSQDPNCDDDNNVYQDAPGTVITSGDLSGAATDISGWDVRGEGS